MGQPGHPTAVGGLNHVIYIYAYRPGSVPGSNGAYRPGHP